MMIRHDVGHSGQSPFLETNQKVFPGEAAFPVGQLHGQQMPSAVGINADRNLNGPGSDDPIFPNLLIAGIENQVGKGFLF